MKIYVMRHGQTDWNLEERIQGKNDIELNARGIEQAEAAAKDVEALGIDLIICSTLKRAKKTAEIVNRNIGAPIIYSDALRERSYGEYEGLTTEDIKDDEILMKGMLNDVNMDLHHKGIESIGELCRRSWRVLDEVKDKYRERTVLLVTHGGTMRAIDAYFNSIPESGRITKPVAENCQVVCYEYKEEKMSLKDLVKKSRSFRAYDESYAMEEKDLLELVDLARLSPTSGNQQALKFYISWEREEVDRIAKCTHWGKERPYPGINPSAFVVIIQDTEIDARQWSWWREAGIAAQSILLGAAEKDLGGLMIGSFDNQPLKDLLGLSESLKILLVLAIGKPIESAIIEDLEPGESTAPVRDENGVTHVKKRRLEDIVLKRR